jgi:hypothetical protein
VTGGKANGQWDLEAAAAAAEAEADSVPFTFAYKGASYSVPAMKRWPAAALAALREGDLASALTMLLGADGYAGLVGAGLTIGELEVLFDKIAAASGLGSLPNSGPPARRVSIPT